MTVSPPTHSTSTHPSGVTVTREMGALIQEDPGIRALANMMTAVGEEWTGRVSYQMLARLRQLRPDADAVVDNPRRVAAFFDVDGTLISSSIVLHLFAQGVGDGEGKVFHALQFALCFVLYKLNLIPARLMYRWGLAPCVGRDLHQLKAFVDRCLETRVKPAVFREAAEAVAAHRAAGHLCVAITGAPEYPAAELSEFLGFHDVLATPTPLEPDGSISCNLEGPLCYSRGKLAFLRAYARLHDVDLARSFLYSDSASDIPVLKAVGRPRVINPQWLLLPAARWNRWPVARWKARFHGGVPVASFSTANLDPQAPVRSV